MGKGAARAIAKNEECVEHYSRIIFKAEQTATEATRTLRDAGLELARVTRTPGCGRLTVTLQDGTTDVSVPIGGTVKMRGHAAQDDSTSLVGNSIAYYSALVKYKVPAQLLIYQKGGHGFAMYNKEQDEYWLPAAIKWMRLNNFLKP